MHPVSTRRIKKIQASGVDGARGDDEVTFQAQTGSTRNGWMILFGKISDKMAINGDWVGF